MSHTQTHKGQLVARVRRIAGQVAAIERALETETGCAVVLQQSLPRAGRSMGWWTRSSRIICASMSPIQASDARYGPDNTAPASYNACGRRFHHPQRQPERQAICPQGEGRSNRLLVSALRRSSRVRARALAAEAEADHQELRIVRERLSLCRRDVSKLIETAIEEAIVLSMTPRHAFRRCTPRRRRSTVQSCLCD